MSASRCDAGAASSTGASGTLPESVDRFSSEHAGKAYDLLAHRYDELYRDNAVIAQSARVSLGILRAVMGTRSPLLELGCGTGRETLAMAALGKHVVACDPSQGALRVLREKAEELGFEDRIETYDLAASKIAALRDAFGAHAFEGAYSSFALSYEPDLEPVRDQVWALLKPSAPFVCSIYNRSCLMEWLLLAPFLVPRRALTRLEGETSIHVDRMSVPIRSYLPSEIRKLFASRFSLERVWGIPALIPPNYLHALVEAAGPLRVPWERLDARWNGRWPFKYLGSHTAYLFVARA